MKKKSLIVILICVCSNFLYAQITINSEPNGAKVYREGEFVGTTPCHTTTNMKAKQLVYDIDAQKVPDPSTPPYSIEFTIVKEGYEPATVYFEGKYVYRESGFGMYKQKYYIVQPKSYKLFAALKKDNTFSNQQPVQVSVEQPEPKQTALVGTSQDIRWHFDSDPEGAKVFWKVNSKIPNVVKNTDLLYLGKTPFNDLRVMNVKGMTEYNADKVEIEIVVEKKGYAKQSKRFMGNVIIDQKEISWSFDLIEETPEKVITAPENEIINKSTESEE